MLGIQSIFFPTVAGMVSFQLYQIMNSSDKNSQIISVYDGKDSQKDPLFTVDNLHKEPVHIMAYSPLANAIVSCDDSGMVEYWTLNEDDKWQHPNTVHWKYKTETDLYEFKKVPWMIV